jgi:hypothetical protein
MVNSFYFGPTHFLRLVVLILVGIPAYYISFTNLKAMSIYLVYGWIPLCFAIFLGKILYKDVFKKYLSRFLFTFLIFLVLIVPFPLLNKAYVFKSIKVNNAAVVSVSEEGGMQRRIYLPKIYFLKAENNLLNAENIHYTLKDLVDRHPYIRYTIDIKVPIEEYDRCSDVKCKVSFKLNVGLFKELFISDLKIEG